MKKPVKTASLSALAVVIISLLCVSPSFAQIDFQVEHRREPLNFTIVEAKEDGHRAIRAKDPQGRVRLVVWVYAYRPDTGRPLNYRFYYQYTTSLGIEQKSVSIDEAEFDSLKTALLSASETCAVQMFLERSTLSIKKVRSKCDPLALTESDLNRG